MIKAIDNIDKLGNVKFADGKTVGGIIGTQQDCEYYGYAWNGSCRLKPAKIDRQKLESNKDSGKQNELLHSFNCDVQGNFHKLTNSNQTIVSGQYVETELNNAEVFGGAGSLGRGQVTTLIFTGTTTDAVYTEIFIGGAAGNRFIVDETKECVLGIEAVVLGHQVDALGVGNCQVKFQHTTYCVSRGVLTAIAISTKTNQKNHAGGWDNKFLATTGTPDYVEVQVKGKTGATIDWTVILTINELRTNEI